MRAMRQSYAPPAMASHSGKSGGYFWVGHAAVTASLACDQGENACAMMR
jgi:hypothetical protein